MTDGELRAYIYAKLDESRSSKSTKERVHSVVRFEPAKPVEWKTKALTDLRDWMLASSQPTVTIETWAAVYIRCGRCVKEWRQWCEDNPIGDLAAWIDAASEVVAAKRWI
jgi:hypothetical protein